MIQKSGLILVSQRRFAEALLKKSGMMNNKHQTALLNANEKLQLEDNFGKADESHFRSIVGSLLYLSHTRPDLMFAVNLISRFVLRPTKHHYGAVKRILHYIAATLSMGLKYESVEDFHLQGYVDSDWGGSVDDH